MDAFLGANHATCYCRGDGTYLFEPGPGIGWVSEQNSDEDRVIGLREAHLVLGVMGSRVCMQQNPGSAWWRTKGPAQGVGEFLRRR